MLRASAQADKNWEQVEEIFCQSERNDLKQALN